MTVFGAGYNFCIMCGAIAVSFIALTVHYRNKHQRFRDANRKLQTELNRACNVPVSNDCRLVAIRRNGRMNVFTFQRGGSIFQIETMGLLSDNPDGWRASAGLEQ